MLTLCAISIAKQVVHAVNIKQNKRMNDNGMAIKLCVIFVWFYKRLPNEKLLVLLIPQQLMVCIFAEATPDFSFIYIGSEQGNAIHHRNCRGNKMTRSLTYNQPSI